MSLRLPTDLPVHAPEDNPYRASRIDRIGPDADRVIKASAFGVVMGGVLLLLAGMTGATGFTLGVYKLAALAGGYGAARGLLRFADAVGAGFLSFIQPSGKSTPYQRDYSYQEALAISGDVSGAIASYVALIEGAPDDVEARIALAELCARSGYAEEAAAAFVDVRRVPGVSARRDLYATSRLADLYGGPLAQPGRALVELRRLAEKHPHTREAGFALAAIARIKAEGGSRL